MNYSELKEIFSDVLPVIHRAAPILGTYFGSPSTGILIGLLAAVAETDACDHYALADKLKKDSNLDGKLKSLEHTHREWLKKQAN